MREPHRERPHALDIIRDRIDLINHHYPKARASFKMLNRAEMPGNQTGVWVELCLPAQLHPPDKLLPTSNTSTTHDFMPDR